MSEKQYSKLVRERRSVRTFDGQGISSEILEQLKTFAGSCSNPYGIPMEFRFLNAKEHGLKSPVIAGTEEYVAVKLKRVPHFEEALGYAMEQFVLDAWSVGIGTTWIGGTMDRAAFEKAMDLSEDEVMPCVSPIGHAAKRMSLKESVMRKGVGADRRKAFEELFYIDDFDRPMKEDEAGELLLPCRWSDGRRRQSTNSPGGSLSQEAMSISIWPKERDSKTHLSAICRKSIWESPYATSLLAQRKQGLT